MILTFFLFLFSSTSALPQGAPSSVCQSLVPFHGGGISPQSGISPYVVVPQRQNGVVLVSIESTLGVRFQGLILQGRTPSGDVIGTFQIPTDAEAHTITCAVPGDTVTHNNPNPKEFLTVTWIPPTNYVGQVIFNSTIAENYQTFWVGVTSNVVDISQIPVNDDPISIRPSGPVSTTPHYYSPEVPQESSADFDPFYTDCSKSKLCFGIPQNCIASKNCKAVVAVTVTGDQYDFELQAGSNAAWVAVGLSDDQKMGDDSVIECVKSANGVVGAYMSWTTAKPYSSTRLTNPQIGIQLLDSKIVDDTIYCKVRRNSLTTINGKTFDLINDMYYLLIAAGSAASTSSVQFHDLTFGASGEQRKLSDVSSLGGASKLLIRLHGSFMLAAWLGAASIGMLLARYYRQTWVGTTMMGKDIWFAWHRGFMALTWLLTLVAFILIFVELKDWSNESNPHAILGTIVTIICFLQPIGAYFRPHPGTSKRPIFNWLHWLGGNAAHIIAIVTLFFAVSLAKAELPMFVDYILAAYVVVYCLTHLLLSGLHKGMEVVVGKNMDTKCLLNCVAAKQSDSRVSSFPMKDLGGSGRSSAYMEQNLDAPYSPLRKFVLGFYILLVAILVIALIVITALAPIEDTWNNLKSSVKKN